MARGVLLLQVSGHLGLSLQLGDCAQRGEVAPHHFDQLLLLGLLVGLQVGISQEQQDVLPAVLLAGLSERLQGLPEALKPERGRVDLEQVHVGNVLLRVVLKLGLFFLLQVFPLQLLLLFYHTHLL